MSEHKFTIGGNPVAIAWTQESAKRYHYRLSSIGGHPTQKELTNSRTAPSAVCKLIWALLPASEFAKYETPEDVFVAIDHETEMESIGEALGNVFSDMSPTPEKKSTSRKSPLRKSN